jgi:DNA-binding NtrC family response regulator
MLREVDALARGADAQSAREINLADEVRRFETELIRSTLLRTGGRQRRAARLLGMKVSTLNAKIKRYGINSADDTQDVNSINVETEVHS